MVYIEGFIPQYVVHKGDVYEHSRYIICNLHDNPDCCPFMARKVGMDNPFLPRPCLDQAECNARLDRERAASEELLAEKLRSAIEAAKLRNAQQKKLSFAVSQEDDFGGIASTKVDTPKGGA